MYIPVRSAVLLVAWFSCGVLAAQDVSDAPPARAKPANEVTEEDMVIKVYQVLDLATRAPYYNYEGSYLPGLREGGAGFFPGQNTPVYGGGYGGGMGGMGGGMGGMGGGGMGGGMFQVPAENPAAPAAGTPGGSGPVAGGGGRAYSPAITQLSRRAVNLAQIIQTIQDTIAPNSWNEVGGFGHIQPFGTSLVVSQSPAVHVQIKDLLEQLRSEEESLQSVLVDAEWLILDRDQLAGIKAPADSKKPGSIRTLSQQALAKLPATARRYSGQIVCSNGQTVYIISGRMETRIKGAQPVASTQIGYQAIVLTPQFGALLQVSSISLPGNGGALLDLRSSVTRPDADGKPVKLLDPDGKDRAVVQIDRLNIATQQLATSVRVPFGESVLVGGMTFPAQDEEAPPETLYLVVSVEPGS